MSARCMHWQTHDQQQLQHVVDHSQPSLRAKDTALLLQVSLYSVRHSPQLSKA